MINVQGLVVEELSGLARSSLIRARILRQEATVIEDFVEQYGDGVASLETVPELRTKAKAHRIHARELLQSAEIENGRDYLRGEWTSPLHYHLNGKNFQYWDCYREQYLSHSLFRGVDPEK